MKYNMKYNSEVQYTSNKKNKGGGFSVLLCQSLQYDSPAFPESNVSLSTTLSCPTLARAHSKRRWSLLAWLKRFPPFLVFGAGKTTLTGSSAAVDTSKHFPLRFRALQTSLRSLTSYDSCHLFAILAGLASRVGLGPSSFASGFNN